MKFNRFKAVDKENNGSEREEAAYTDLQFQSISGDGFLRGGCYFVQQTYGKCKQCSGSNGSSGIAGAAPG